MKKLVSAILAFAAILFSCVEPVPVPVPAPVLPDGNENSLQFDRIELNKAQYAAVLYDMKTNPTFVVVDQSGEVVTPRCLFTQTLKNGSRKTTDSIQVKPLIINDLDDGKYLLLEYCELFDAKGKKVYLQGNEQNQADHCFLVRTSDGQVFDMTDVQSVFEDFERGEYQSKSAANGDLFFTCGNVIYKIVFNGSKAEVKRLTQQVSGFNKLLLTDKENVFLTPNFPANRFKDGVLMCDEVVVHYAGGQQEIIDVQKYARQYNGDATLFHVGGKVKLFVKSKSASDPSTGISTVTISVCDVNIDSKPPHKLENFAQFTTNEENWYRTIGAVVECSKHYVIEGGEGDQVLACDKTNNSIIHAVEGFNRMYWSLSELVGSVRFHFYKYEGRVFRYDFEALTHNDMSVDVSQVAGTIDCDDPLVSASASTYAYYASGVKTMIYEINALTGQFKVFPLPPSTFITHFAKINSASSRGSY